MRIAITGGPNTGKTTLAESMDGEIFHTDDLIDLPWREQSDKVCEWFDKENYIIEGVTVARGLRKFLEKHPNKKPCDKLIILTRPYFQTDNQERMAKTHDTIISKIRPQLEELGIEICFLSNIDELWLHSSRE